MSLLLYRDSVKDCLMDVLVGTLHSFILGPDLLLVRTGVSQSMIAEVRFNSYELLQCFKFNPR